MSGHDWWGTRLMSEHLNKEKKILENAAAQLMEEASKRGADSVETCAYFYQRSRISLEKQDYHLASSDEGFQMGLRVLKGQKQGFVSLNSVEPDELRSCAEEAVKIASFSPDNPYWSIQNPPSSVPSQPHLDLWDPSFSHVSFRTQLDWIQRMKQEILSDSRIRLNEGSVELSKSLSLITNSKGVHQFERDTSCVWSLMGMAQDENRVTSFDYFTELSRTHQKVIECMVKSTRSFQKALLKNLKVSKPRSYRGKVLFSPRAVIDILLDSLIFHLNGRVVLEKSSRWSCAHLGQAQLSPLITLKDSAWSADRFSCGLFDREGTPTTELELFSAGVLNHFLLDHYSAKGLHLSSNGHASGGPSSAPSVGSHSLSLSPGETSLTKLIQMADPQSEGVLWINRYSGQTDPVSGDFSGVAKGSEWWVAGEFQHCVEETLISGNIFECLNQNLLGLSLETELVDSSNESPYLLADGVSVTAG